MITAIIIYLVCGVAYTSFQCGLHPERSKHQLTKRPVVFCSMLVFSVVFWPICLWSDQR